MRFRVTLAAALAVFAVLSFGADAGPIAGSASLSGTVQAPKAFQAAQVHLLNVDKNVLFMVWTSGGRYQAVNLFPGKAERPRRKQSLRGGASPEVLETFKSEMGGLPYLLRCL